MFVYSVANEDSRVAAREVCILHNSPAKELSKRNAKSEPLFIIELGGTQLHDRIIVIEVYEPNEDDNEDSKYMFPEDVSARIKMNIGCSFTAGVSKSIMV